MLNSIIRNLKKNIHFPVLTTTNTSKLALPSQEHCLITTAFASTPQRWRWIIKLFYFLRLAVLENQPIPDCGESTLGKIKPSSSMTISRPSA